MRLFRVLVCLTFLLSMEAQAKANTPAIELAGLHCPATVFRDRDGVRHIQGCDEHDTLFLHGWFQAEDRLFQLDTLRRTASGTLAELVGTSALPSDVQLRTTEASTANVSI